MRGRSLDAGGPLWVEAPGDDGDGVSVDARFETLDVERRTVVLAVRTAEHDDDGSLYATSEPTPLSCVLDTGECTPIDDPAGAFLVAHPWFEERLQTHMDHLRQRAWRALAQRDRESAARRVLERASGGAMIAFDRLFPADWDLLFLHDDALYWVVDQYCPNPACDCSSVALTAYEVRGKEPARRMGEASVDLAGDRPRLDVATDAARELFDVFWDKCAERLRPRRDEARRVVLRYAAPPTKSVSRVSRNARCPCGSGKKYKRCCLNAGVDAAPPGLRS